MEVNNSDLELVAQITKEQEHLKSAVKKIEAALRTVIANFHNATIIDRWWLNLAKQQLLSGVNSLTSALSVPMNEQNLSAIKKILADQAAQSSQSEPQVPGEQSEATASTSAENAAKEESPLDNDATSSPS